MEHKILTPEQIKQVKGLGCLQDKRYTDVFNVRTIKNEKGKTVVVNKNGYAVVYDPVQAKAAFRKDFAKTNVLKVR